MATKNISIRTDSATLDQIDAVAKAQDRSRNWWINRAIDQALSAERQWAEQIERGLRAAEADDFATDAEVDAVFKSFNDHAR